MLTPVVALVTYDAKELETSKILECIRDFRALGVEVIASDGGSSPELVSGAIGLGARVLTRPNSHFGIGQRQAMEEAAKHGDIVIYSEGDKGGRYGFARHLSSLVSFMEDSESDLVMIGRTPVSLATYPELQRYSEASMAVLYTEIVRDMCGAEIRDTMYGPKMVSSKHVGDFLASREPHFGASYEPLLVAAKNNRRFGQMDIEMEWPFADEMKSKKAAAFRAFQFLDIVTPIFTFEEARNPQKLLDFYIPKVAETLSEIRRMSANYSD